MNNIIEFLLYLSAWATLISGLLVANVLYKLYNKKELSPPDKVGLMVFIISTSFILAFAL